MTGGLIFSERFSSFNLINIKTKYNFPLLVQLHLEE